MALQQSVSPRFVGLELGVPYDWDDYDLWCSIYFDLAERKVVADYYGHGSGGKVNEKEVIPYKEAVEIGLVSVGELAQAILNFLDLSVGDRVVGTYNRPCAVEGGRKMRGDNLILVEIFKKPSFVQPRYGNEKNYDTLALVYDPVKNVKCEVKIDYVTFDIDSDNVVVNAVVANPIKHLASLVHCTAYKVSLHACDTRYLMYDLREIYRAGLTFSRVKTPDMDSVRNPWETKRVNTKQEKNRAKVEAWARQKLAGESEEKIQQVIQRTLDKYYV